MELVKNEETGINQREPELKKAEKKPKYDPNKRYQWQPSDQFVVSGQEFSLILNSLRTFLARPESQAVLRAEQAHFAVEEAIARAVELGVAKEMPEPTQDPSGKK